MNTNFHHESTIDWWFNQTLVGFKQIGFKSIEANMI